MEKGWQFRPSSAAPVSYIPEVDHTGEKSCDDTGRESPTVSAPQQLPRSPPGARVPTSPPASVPSLFSQEAPNLSPSSLPSSPQLPPPSSRRKTDLSPRAFHFLIYNSPPSRPKGSWNPSQNNTFPWVFHPHASWGLLHNWPTPTHQPHLSFQYPSLPWSFIGTSFRQEWRRVVARLYRASNALPWEDQAPLVASPKDTF